MIVFHLTSQYHLPVIMAAGFLKTVESNVSMERLKAGPDVVHLTTNIAPVQEWMVQPRNVNFVQKGRIRFTLNVPDADLHPWEPWMLAHGAKRYWMEALTATDDSSQWWMCERPIPWEEWVRIEDNISGQVLWSQSLEQIENGVMHLVPGTYASPAGQVRYRITEPTWKRLAGFSRSGIMVGESGLPDIWVAAGVSKRLEEYRKPGMDDDTTVNAALEAAERVASLEDRGELTPGSVVHRIDNNPIINALDQAEGSDRAPN